MIKQAEKNAHVQIEKLGINHFFLVLEEEERRNTSFRAAKVT